MASQELKQRVAHDPDTTTNMNDKSRGGGSNGSNKRTSMAKRGLRSLIIAISIPLSLTLFSSYIASSSSRAYLHRHPHPHAHAYPHSTSKPFWFPPSWALHLSSPASSLLMGLSAWMVWADGGFHRHPMALLSFSAQLLFTLLWDPLVLGVGATGVGMLVLLGLFASLFACMRMFGHVNHVAGDLIKPCLAWTAFLSIVNLKLLYV